MPTLKTTVNVSSANIAAMPVNYTSTVDNFTKGDSNVGKITVNTETPTYLEVTQTGAKGAYLYVRSPKTNSVSGAITIYSDHAMDISDMVVNAGTSGAPALNPTDFAPQPIFTIYPGEAAFVPVSFQQGKLFAKSTYGTAELEYVVANRGGEFGKSTIFTYVDRQTNNWNYVLFDARTGEPGMPVDTGFDYDDYDLNYSTMVQDKGFVLYAYDGSSYFILVDTHGKMVEHDIPGNPAYWHLDSKGLVFTYPNGSGYTVALFDGDNIYYHIFTDAGNAYLNTDSWDRASADGTACIVVENYENTGSTAYVLINGDTSSVISNLNYGDTGMYAYVESYTYSNFAVVKVYNADDYLDSLKIFDTNGALLKSVKLLNDESPVFINSMDFNFYGTGKMVMVCYNYNNTNQPYQLFHYDQSNNILMGERLDWTHEHGSTFDDFEVHCDNLYPGYEYDYKPESCAIVFYDYYDDNWNYFLNLQVRALDVVYVLPGAITPITYEANNRYNDPIWISTWTDSLSLTDRGFNLFHGDLDTTPYLGGLYRTRFTPGAAPVTTTVISDLDTVDAYQWNLYNNPSLTCDVLLYTDLDNGTTKYVAHDKTILDTLTLSAEYEENIRIHGSSIFIRTWGTQTLVNYYFSLASKRFAQLPIFYSQRSWDSSFTPNCLADNKMILFKPYYYSNNDTFSARFLINGAVTPDVVLLTNGSDYYDWDYSVTSKGLTFMYKLNEFDEWTFDIYDNSLKKIYSLQVEANGSNWPYWWNDYGEVEFIGAYVYNESTDTNDLTLYGLTSNQIQKTKIYGPFNINYGINDSRYWEF